MDIPKMGIVYHAARAELLEIDPNVSDEVLIWLNRALKSMFELGVATAIEAAKRQGEVE